MYDLGTLGGGRSEGYAVNADGTVVIGWSFTENNRERAFRWEDGAADGVAGNPEMQDLGTLTGERWSVANDVSADGAVVVGDSGNRAFIWRSGSMLDHVNTVNEVLGSVAQQIGALEMRNSVVAGFLGREIDFGTPSSFGGTLSTKAAPGEAPLPFGLRVEAGLSADGSDTATFAGLVVGAALRPDLSAGAHFSRGVDGGTSEGFRFTGPYDTFGGHIRGGDRYDGFTWKLAVANSDGTARIIRPGALRDTEAGSGEAKVATMSASVEASYALRVNARTIVAPILRFTHAKTTRDAYAEDNGISFPASYDVTTTKLKTVTLGADVFHAATETLTLRANLGMEADLWRDASPINGTSAIPGLTSFSLEPGKPDYPVRVSASAGATYNVGAHNAVTVDAGPRQNAFSGDFAASGSVGYEIRL